jgi:hypothetical protein
MKPARRTTGPDALDLFFALLWSHMSDPEAARLAVNSTLAAHGQTSVPANAAEPAAGFLADVSATVLERFRVTHAVQPIDWWLAFLESLDFAAAGVSATIGGQTVYVRKNSTPDQKAEVIAAHLRAGVAPEDAFRAAGVSRATGYRLAARRQRRGPGA